MPLESQLCQIFELCAGKKSYLLLFPSLFLWLNTFVFVQLFNCLSLTLFLQLSMSRISSRREQAGVYGEERSDSVTSLTENNLFTWPLCTLPFTNAKKGAENGDTAGRKMKHGRLSHHYGPQCIPGGPPVPAYLFQDCHLNFERVEEGLESADLEAVSACQEFWRRKLTQSSCLSK